jgi:hypothetical protein
MRRREFITLVAGATVTSPFAAVAQEPGRTYRLGLSLPFPREAAFNTALLDELRRDGFIEGKKPWPFLAGAGFRPGNCPRVEEATGAPNSFAV